MSFFSWMRAARPQPGATTGPVEAETTARLPWTPLDPMLTRPPMDPSAIADAVVLLRMENDRATQLCAKADVVVKGQEYQLSILRERNSLLETSNQELKATTKSLEKALHQQNSPQVLQAQRLLKEEQDKCKAMRTEILEAQVMRRLAENNDLYVDANGAANERNTLPDHAGLRSTPFVVVLVDGDSYQFPPPLDTNQKSDNRGQETAHNLYREVTKYILSHPHIPPHSKIVVRIFCNRSSLEGKTVRPVKRLVKADQPQPIPVTARLPSEKVKTMIKFAETYPLFDYLDCGGGKERADDKIRENCHLYMGDRDCYTVFLAVCNDNGYVRMLERYDGNSIASAKIVLLTNGKATTEIEKLSFPKVELSGVFTPMYRRKREGSSRKMGPLQPASHLLGYQSAADYDLDYRDPPIQAHIDEILNNMRAEKQQRHTTRAVFPRLAYESDERYEERLRSLLPFPRPSVSHGRDHGRSVGYIGLRKSRPAGMLPTAPMLPFLLQTDTTQSANTCIPASGTVETLEGPDDVDDEMGWALD